MSHVVDDLSLMIKVRLGKGQIGEIKTKTGRVSVTAPAASDTGPRASSGADMRACQGSKLLGKASEVTAILRLGNFGVDVRSGVSLLH